MKITSILTLIGSLLALTGAPAEAATKHHCVKQGRPVSERVADIEDLKLPLKAGEKVQLPVKLAINLVDMRAYGPNGEASQEFDCSARNHVDLWFEWRRHGKLLATFDGLTFRAYSATDILGWTS
jgi:hypothetical protein